MKKIVFILLFFFFAKEIFSQQTEFYTSDTVRISIQNPYYSSNPKIGNWHPSVVYFKNGWGKLHKKYWMAWTPNLVFETKWENPCIAYSDDGIHWDTTGINNPIVDDPVKFYNADTELFYNESKDTLYCAWKCSDGHTWVKKSGDGLYWGSHIFNKDSKVLLNYFWYNNLLNSKICPSVTVEDNDTKYYVYIRLGRDYLENWGHYRWTLDSNFKVLDTSFVEILNNPLMVNSWHFDVFKNPKDKYYYLITDGAIDNKSVWDGSFIWLARSTDTTGKKFSYYRRPLLPKGPWYRATALLKSDTLMVWCGSTIGEIFSFKAEFNDLISWLQNNNSLLTVISPHKKEKLNSNKYYNISWDFWENKNNIEKVNIEYSTDKGLNWTSIANNIPSKTKHLFWNIPSISSDSCMIKIEDASNSNEYSISGSFSIANTIESQEERDTKIVFALYQNYPNPFNNLTTIKFSVPKEESVTLKIYDILGNEVKTLLNNTKVEGTQEINFDCKELKSGIYIYKINAGESFSCKRMVLIK